MKFIIFILSIFPFFLDAQTLTFEADRQTTCYSENGVTSVNQDKKVKFFFTEEEVCVFYPHMNWCEEVIQARQSGKYQSTAKEISLSSATVVYTTSHSDWLVFLDASLQVFKVKEIPAVGPKYRIFSKHKKRI